MANITVPAEFIAMVDEKGLMSIEVSNFFNLVGDLAIAEGSGSPEGVLEARVTKLYMDTAGTAGNILYVKRDSDIGGDATQGWILV